MWATKAWSNLANFCRGHHDGYALEWWRLFWTCESQTWRKIWMRWQCLNIHDKVLKLFFSSICHEALPAPASSVAVTWFQMSFLFKAFSGGNIRWTFLIRGTHASFFFLNGLPVSECINKYITKQQWGQAYKKITGAWEPLASNISECHPNHTQY